MKSGVNWPYGNSSATIYPVQPESSDRISGQLLMFDCRLLRVTRDQNAGELGNRCRKKGLSVHKGTIHIYIYILLGTFIFHFGKKKEKGNFFFNGKTTLIY